MQTGGNPTEQIGVDVWWRLLSYVRPYWRSLVFAVGFGLLTASLWSAALSLTFPVVKVFLQGEHLADYVQSQVDDTDQQLHDCRQQLDILAKQIELASSNPRDPERLRLVNAQSRAERRLNRLSSREWMLHWAQANLLPLLPQDELHLLVLVFAVQLVVTACKGVCMFFQDVLIGRIGELAVIDLRKAMFRRLLKLDPQTIALQGPPQLISRMTYDLQSVSAGMSLLGGDVVREPLKALACLTLAFWVNWQLTLFSLVFIPFAGLLYWKMSRRLKRALILLQESIGRIFQVLEETFHAAKYVIASNTTQIHLQQFNVENRHCWQATRRLIQIDALTGPLTELLGLLAVLAALLPGAYLVLNHAESIWGIRLSSSQMDIAELSTLYALLAGTLDPVRKFSKIFPKIKQTSTAAERVFEVFDLATLVPEPESPQWLPRLQSSVEFEGIHFCYARAPGDTSARPPAIRDVSLKIRAGETIALVGGNGSGKSSLVNLLPRFYDPDEGAVRIDGVDLRSVRSKDLRSQIAVVSQETLLFDETIAENIRYGCPNATTEQIREAARKAHVLDFTDQLPEGLNTPVGPQGRALSGGQRQRIALARAMLRNPAILILDEPTSAIDAQSEALIQQSLAEFVRGRTTFLVTHCLSPALLEFIDRIAVLDRGTLIAIGQHRELLASCPLYSRLYAAQTHSAAA